MKKVWITFTGRLGCCYWLTKHSGRLCWILKSDGSPCIVRWLFSTMQNCDFSQVDISGTIRVISLKFRYIYFSPWQACGAKLCHISWNAIWWLELWRVKVHFLPFLPLDFDSIMELFQPWRLQKIVRKKL